MTPEITVRPATAADTDAVNLLTQVSFGISATAAELELEAKLFPIENSLVAVADGRIVGHVATAPQTVTVPGERAMRLASIANVVVDPAYRRRGILRSLYNEHHRAAEADGFGLTMFTASQGTIYGRFGYAPAIVEHHIRFDRRFARFLATTPDPGGAHTVPIDVARQRIPHIYDRWQRLVPGAQQRPEPAWEQRFADHPSNRGGGTPLFALLHDDGYALYRYRRDDTGAALAVVELRAVTVEAHAALWRTLVALELFDQIETVLAPDDPLPYLFDDPRLVQTLGHRDGVWLRIMDVPAALTARDYLGELDTVLAVTDSFRNAGGTFALRVRDGVAECEPTTRPAEVELGIEVLAGMYFGAHQARVFAAANRLQAKDSGQVRALDAAFATAREPVLGWFF